MRTVAIVTDSTQYLPRGTLAVHDIHVVSLYVSWGGVLHREATLEGYESFYADLRDAPELPTTSQPSIGDFLAVWEPLLEAGRDVASIHLAGGVSGTVDAARQARGVLAERGLGDRVAVVDGRTACGGLGCVVLAAARAASEGANLAAVIESAAAARAALKAWFAIDTLEYLRRGGRIGQAQAWLGGALKIKPILAIDHEITPVERVRTSRRAFARMVELLRSCRDAGCDGWVVQHIQASDQARLLVDAGREMFGSEPIVVSEVGPVIGTYTGPGLLGVGGVPRRMVPDGLPFA